MPGSKSKPGSGVLLSVVSYLVTFGARFVRVFRVEGELAGRAEEEAAGPAFHGLQDEEE